MKREAALCLRLQSHRSQRRHQRTSCAVVRKSEFGATLQRLQELQPNGLALALVLDAEGPSRALELIPREMNEGRLLLLPKVGELKTEIGATGSVQRSNAELSLLSPILAEDACEKLLSKLLKKKTVC